MPERTCVGCRAVKDKRELVRLVACCGTLVVDGSGVMPGRGAYLCPDQRCLDSAYAKKESFSRALKRKVALPDAVELWSKIKGRT